MTARATFTQAQIERAIRAAKKAGMVAVQTTTGIAFLDPDQIAQDAPKDGGKNTCDGIEWGKP
ncbi:hypothetical protein [Neotabrizicola sp. sgz301269]|uniref:hypothetical protein n=1 Tax=Neotabrizicola sp. sgz301269 TaxID=3276282 RepID=UPI00377074D6